MMNTTMRPDPRDYEIRIWYSAEKGDECFIAQVVEWPGIMAHGDTREEAARQIQLALEGVLEVAAEQGIKPENAALEAALDRGLKDVEAGRVRPAEEVKAMIPGWTSKS